MKSTEGIKFDQRRRPTPIVSAPSSFFDDEAPEAAEDDERRRWIGELLPGFFRLVLDIIEDGTDKSMAVRVAALRRIAGHTPASQRKLAKGRKFSRSALSSAEKRICERYKIGRFFES